MEKTTLTAMMQTAIRALERVDLGDVRGVDMDWTGYEDGSARLTVMVDLANMVDPMEQWKREGGE